MSETYERGEYVRVQVRDGCEMRARVLLDIGDETLIVSRSEPRTTKRVHRTMVRPDVRDKSMAEERETVSLQRQPIDTASLYCLESEAGLCALQRQSSPPSRAQLVHGTWSLCGTWLTSRSKPTRTKPTCSACLDILKEDTQ